MLIREGTQLGIDIARFLVILGSDGQAVQNQSCNLCIFTFFSRSSAALCGSVDTEPGRHVLVVVFVDLMRTVVETGTFRGDTSRLCAWDTCPLTTRSSPLSVSWWPGTVHGKVRATNLVHQFLTSSAGQLSAFQFLVRLRAHRLRPQPRTRENNQALCVHPQNDVRSLLYNSVSFWFVTLASDDLFGFDLQFHDRGAHSREGSAGGGNQRRTSSSKSFTHRRWLASTNAHCMKVSVRHCT